MGRVREFGVESFDFERGKSFESGLTDKMI